MALAVPSAGRVPSAGVAGLDDSGHWPFADDPDAVERLVEPFLRGAVGIAR